MQDELRTKTWSEHFFMHFIRSSQKLFLFLGEFTANEILRLCLFFKQHFHQFSLFCVSLLKPVSMQTTLPMRTKCVCVCVCLSSSKEVVTEFDAK